MKTDVQLKADVRSELMWDPAVKETGIGVLAKDGVVTLTGHLDTYAEKYAAERAVQRVEGVKAIAMEIDVKISPEHKRSDTEIAQAIEHSLKWNSTVPADQVKVSVERGWVTLKGELPWEYQRRSVEKAIRPLQGVTGIANLIAVKPSVVASGVHTLIEDALTRQAMREAKRVEVSVDGSKVTLRGRVNSWHERNAAQGAAWSAPGVTTVVNELLVGP